MQIWPAIVLGNVKQGSGPEESASLVTADVAVFAYYFSIY